MNSLTRPSLQSAFGALDLLSSETVKEADALTLFETDAPGMRLLLGLPNTQAWTEQTQQRCRWLLAIVTGLDLALGLAQRQALSWIQHPFPDPQDLSPADRIHADGLQGLISLYEHLKDSAVPRYQQQRAHIRAPFAQDHPSPVDRPFGALDLLILPRITADDLQDLLEISPTKLAPLLAVPAITEAITADATFQAKARRLLGLLIAFQNCTNLPQSRALTWLANEAPPALGKTPLQLFQDREVDGYEMVYNYLQSKAMGGYE
ncbi:hypothetical protein [Ferrimonas marina]|uniref:Uncharacterized protein n=1 Tax=Ferrimonas marina TaxID=299255 RepID=A0A1M5TWK9_9GAMM|nr:hypothetical protein [Ferrimonas marina]SHH55177.1 hypothetical protein SAMN02745129_2308 [Ferrimonas marina]